MKNIISDPPIIASIKDKLSGWISEHLRGLDSAQPEVNILEICEYPLRRLVIKAEVQTRKITQFNKAGPVIQSAPASAQSQVGEIDVWSVESEKIDDFVNGKKLVEIPASLKSTPCKKCEGTGKISCPDCQGQKSVYCVACHGDGTVICPKCKKTMKIGCKACEGRGKVYSDTQQAYVNCTQCDGKGSFPCGDCKNGRNPCAECGGNGRIPCRKCAESGSMECTACCGKGSFVSGSGVEIISATFEDKLDIPNPDIPDSIVNGEFPAVSYEVERTVSHAGQGTDADVPAELTGQMDILKKRIQVPLEGRIIKNYFIIEKKSYFNMTYTNGSDRSSAWFLIAGGKALIESKFLKEMYSQLMATLEQNLKNGDTAVAQQIIKKIENIPALRSEVGNIKTRLVKSVLPAYIAGSTIGFAASSALLMAYEFHAWKASLNLNTVAALSLAGVFALSSAVVPALITAGPSSLNTFKKRTVSAALPSVFLSILLICGFATFNISPAKYMDAKQMRQEYNAHFPFGLRTLASKEDVEFLWELIKKYTPTGIDLAQVTKDFEWLAAKQRSDENNMEKIEKSARSIEQASGKYKQQQQKYQKKRTFKRLQKIYVQ